MKKKFCPKCREEFTQESKICPKDKLELVSHLPAEKIAKFVDVYAACDEIEAERIVSFLTSENVAAAEYERGVVLIPSPSDIRYIIKVPIQSVTHTKKRLEQARLDGIISKTGTFL